MVKVIRYHAASLCVYYGDAGSELERGSAFYSRWRPGLCMNSHLHTWPETVVLCHHWLWIGSNLLRPSYRTIGCSSGRKIRHRWNPTKYVVLFCCRGHVQSIRRVERHRVDPKNEDKVIKNRKCL